MDCKLKCCFCKELIERPVFIWMYEGLYYHADCAICAKEMDDIKRRLSERELDIKFTIVNQ